jgi:hypothetical protein
MDARGVRELLKIKLAREFHGDAKVAAERTGLDIDHFKAIISRGGECVICGCRHNQNGYRHASL